MSIIISATFNVKNIILHWVLKFYNVNSKWQKKIQEWLSGKNKPTIKQLESLSKSAKVPLGYLFLNKPPKLSFPLVKFRTINNAPVVDPSVNLRDVVRNIKYKQTWLTDYRINNGYGKIPFVGRGRHNHDTYSKTADHILHYFNLDVGWNIGNKSRNKFECFKYLRNILEDNGISVMINSYVNNSTRRHLNQNEFRAFVLINDYAPFIFINSNDSYNARLFSLIHELVHIWFGRPELFNYNFDNNSNFNNKKEEKTINRIVENILFPKKYFELDWNGCDGDVFNHISNLSAWFNGSKMATTIRALHLKLINQKTLDEIRNQINKEYRIYKYKKHNGGGPSYYKFKEFKLGKNFTNNVINSAEENKTSYTDAFELLGISSNEGLSKLIRTIRKDTW